MKKTSEKKSAAVAFIDRDGALIREPDSLLVGSPDEVQILPGVIAGLKTLVQSGYKLAMITNQDGLGSSSYPLSAFDATQKKLLEPLKKEGVVFDEVFVCPHMPDDGCDCRKPKTGLVKKFLKDTPIDLERSFVVGDRETDMQLATNLGITGYKMERNSSFPRIAAVARTSKETDVFIRCNLDGQGIFDVDTGVKFFDHMLEQLSKHSLVDLTIRAKGDIAVDDHHTVEDVGLVLGEVLLQALGERKGIRRYGFLLPMDDTLVEVAIDLGGRPYLVFNAEFKREKVGDLPTEMVEHFFRSVADALKANIHINVKYSRNEHHKIEAIFKSFAKALRMAVENDSRQEGALPSTKGVL